MENGVRHSLRFCLNINFLLSSSLRRECNKRIVPAQDVQQRECAAIHSGVANSNHSLSFYQDHDLLVLFFDVGNLLPFGTWLHLDIGEFAKRYYCLETAVMSCLSNGSHLFKLNPAKTSVY